MSQENVELARRGYAALNEAYRRHDIDPLRALAEETWHPDIVGGGTGRFPDTHEWRGREGVLSFVAAQTEAFEQMWLEVDEIVDLEERLIVLVRFGGRARHTGLPLEFTAVHVWTMADGRAARFDVYETKAQAFEALGLTDRDVG